MHVSTPSLEGGGVLTCPGEGDGCEGGNGNALTASHCRRRIDRASCGSRLPDADAVASDL